MSGKLINVNEIAKLSSSLFVSVVYSTLKDVQDMNMIECTSEGVQHG